MSGEMDSLIESCDKRVNEILCGLKDEIQACKNETGQVDFFQFSNICLDTVGRPEFVFSTY